MSNFWLHLKFEKLLVFWADMMVSIGQLFINKFFACWSNVLTFNFYDSTRVIFLPPKQKPHLWARADFREGWSQRSSDEFFLFQGYPAMEQTSSKHCWLSVICCFQWKRLSLYCQWQHNNNFYMICQQDRFATSHLRPVNLYIFHNK